MSGLTTAGRLTVADLSKVTTEQKWVMDRHSKMIGRVLDIIDASYPAGVQCEKVKKLLQVPLYDFRLEVMKKFTGVPEHITDSQQKE